MSAGMGQVTETGRKMREAEDAEVRGEDAIVVFHIPDAAPIEHVVRVSNRF